ncbi:MAG TPA: NTP transferase domain-containing protein [Myxococcota bacterium]|nr:NTP transferase domain-containing protein [Myxococcota bacterium]
MTLSDNRMLGLVLAGGKSARMNEAKAHLRIEGKPQWQRAEEALSAVCDEVYFSVSPLLTTPLPIAKERQISDIFNEPCGPIGGIISAFKKYPHKSLFVLACDMPFFDAHAAQFLLANRAEVKLATIFDNEQSLIEPLCGIYEPAIFPHLLLAWSSDKTCARRAVSELDIKRVKPLEEKWLVNVNNREELLKFMPKTDDTSLKKLNVHYYASLRQQRECSNEEISSFATTILELFHELALMHSFREDPYSLRFAKNDRLVAPNEMIEDGDKIVFLPPVSGG